RLVVRGRLITRLEDVEHGTDSRARGLSSSLQSVSDIIDVSERDPAFTHEESTDTIEVEQIQRVVHRLLQVHLLEPGHVVVGGGLEYSEAVLSRLSNHSLQVGDAGANLSDAVLSFLRRPGTVGEELRLEAIGDLVDDAPESISLVEDDKHRLVHLVSLLRVLQLLLDIRRAHVGSVMAGSPEHSFKDGDALATNHTDDVLNGRLLGVSSGALLLLLELLLSLAVDSPGEELVSLVQHGVPLLEIGEVLLQQTIRLVHVLDVTLEVVERRLKLIQLSRGHRIVISIVDSPSDRHAVLLDLRLEETQFPLHLIESADVAHKDALERVNVRVELLELHAAILAQLGDHVEGGVLLDDELAEAHLLRTVERAHLGLLCVDPRRISYRNQERTEMYLISLQ
ncbi:hypothetical protein PMAYCL1PPCAC_20774, partial [Pristionchus mayeri]